MEDVEKIYIYIKKCPKGEKNKEQHSIVVVSLPRCNGCHHFTRVRYGIGEWKKKK